MKYVGIALLLLGAYLASLAYRARLRERLELLLGYTDLVREMRSRAANFLEPVSRWIGGFECPALERAGFLSAVRGGVRLRDALSRACEGLDGTVCDALDELFSRTGECLADEVKRIERALVVLEESVVARKSACEERTRMFSVLALAASAGVAVLVL